MGWSRGCGCRSPAKSELVCFPAYLLLRVGTDNHNLGTGVQRYKYWLLIHFTLKYQSQSSASWEASTVGTLFTCLFRSSLIHRQGYPAICVKSRNMTRIFLEAGRKFNILRFNVN